MRTRPDEAVADWTARQPAASLYTTSITQAEILYGIQRLASGKRRTGLESAAQMIFGEDFAGRILGFDSHAAITYARIAAARERAGRPISQFDAQIAAITSTARATLATRDIDDYHGCGVKLVDPWND